MSIDPDFLRKLSVKHPTEQQGVEALIRGIHRTAGLREWVTIESVALVPVPVNRNGRWILLALLTVPKRLNDGTDGYLAPWGAVEWSWPEHRVVQMIDLRQHEEISKMREQQKFIRKCPAGEEAPLDLIIQARRENTLFDVLDTLLITPPAEHPKLDQLANFYTGLLPAEIYAYYWTLVPASKEWLRPDVPVATYANTKPEGDTEANVKAGISHGPEKREKSDTSAGDTQGAAQYQQHVENPADLSSQIERWLRNSSVLAESFGIQAVTTELRTLDARWKMPGFRLAFVGEFNRGKSTLINRILGRPLLPVRVLPTTATLTSIVAGPEDRMEVYFPDGRQEIRQLEAASWSDLTAHDRPDMPQEISPNVRVTLNHPWLEKVDIEVIDTPGAGDLNARRTALISDVLSQSDAAVLLISAVLPLSMTERAFLEQEVLGRHIPLVLVVVSMLDTLAQDQQSIVFNAVRRRLDQVSPLIPLVPAHAINAGTTEAEALEAVRMQIEALVGKSDRRAWRSRQVAGTLADHLGQLVEIGHTAISVAQMDAAKREEARKKARAERRSAQSHWETISLQLDQRYLSVDQELRRRLNAARDNLVEMMSFELSKTADPKSWWEKDFPFRLRREFLGLARIAESFIIDSLARDVKWLQDEVARVFSVRMSQNLGNTPTSHEIAPHLRDMTLTDVQRLRLFSRVGSGVSMIAGYLLIGPIGSAISIASGIISDYLLSQKIEEQRQRLQDEVVRSIELTLEEYIRLLSERLHTLYNQIAQDMKREQSAWLAAKDAAIQAASETSVDDRVWQQLIDEASKLQREIQTALAK